MIAIIAAISQNGVIGVDGELPWSIPADMREFKRRTEGGMVVMGRKTWESIPERFRPLIDRRNYVLSSSKKPLKGATVSPSLPDALAEIRTGEWCWIIGGESVYREGLKYANRIHLTVVHQRYTEGNLVYFPTIPRGVWRLHRLRAGVTSTQQPPITFTVFERQGGEHE